MLKKYFGDRAFYRYAFAVALPIIIQNGIGNFVSLLDNIMIGQVGTVQMNGVSIVNQLIFVFNLCIFGATSGAGIFTAQFHGCKDHEGVRNTFRFKILIGLLLSAVAVAVFLLFGDPLIRLYLQGEGTPEDAALTLQYGLQYLKIMLWGLPIFAISNAYAGTLRESGQTVVPMVASSAAVFVNMGLNFVLIFGHLGFEPMGIRGAAIATVISRYVELAIVAGWTHWNPTRNIFIQGAYRTLRIPGPLLKTIIVKGMPLLLNEAFWSTAMAIMSQCYSTRGLDVVAAQNINSALYNLSSVVYMAMGNSVGIIIGQMLGAGKSEEEVRDTDRKLIVTSVLSCLIFGSLMVAVSGIFPQVYNTSDEIRSLATKLICISALFLPFNAYTHATYFTLRSGGQTWITFLYDCCYVWTLCVPLAFCLSRFTTIGILNMFFLCHCLDFVKCFFGAAMIKQGKWIHNLTK